ncbi:DNA polymerase III subunit delta [Methylococcus sp. EFPC2]|uniref:DNA polymerase III subunit delta n=1 Tax=Methylococcus sp. EFPC2 TaxID=2812648 RepID=UPI001966E1F1|nr:DNA polymerase III subunit delta [Methylococcus sp. EFPC2]QSA98653.1 DNA polymerase III subunit delta [Methylococcus sp. EFPC2]
MKIKPEQLDATLKRQLAPVYLLSGDEPLQLNEAADAVRCAALGRGYENRELFYAESGFDWNRLLESGGSFSLFGELRVLDLRLPGKPDKDGAQALLRYAQHLPDDAVLVVSLPKLSAAEQKAAWFQTLESKGVFVQIWPLEGARLIEWLDRRMAGRNLLADRSGLAILAARVEGNLLAAAQEVEKLHILYGEGRIEDEQIRKAVADSARYDVYDLAEAAMLGQLPRAQRILQGLKAEGVASPVVLWALARDVRTLAGVLNLTAGGESQESAYAKLRIWDKQKSALSKALQRLDRRDVENALLACARADRIIKGQAVGEAWSALLDICTLLTGKAPLSRFVAAALA